MAGRSACCRSPPTGGQCGADWARSALQWLLSLEPNQTVYLRYDAVRTGANGVTLAAPLWRRADGVDFNLSIVMVYAGLAKAADVDPGAIQFHDWANASQAWAQATHWNMWAPGQPFALGC
jgi:endonuclease YncB( thermonuclease family)